MEINFEKSGGLVPVIIQDANTKNVLMLGYMNKEAYDKTLLTKKVTFWSRSGEDNESNPLLFLTELQDFIDKRHKEMPEGSYTTSLFKDGINRIAQKVGEEALETVIEATNGNKEKLVYEASDLIYHLIVLMTSKELRIEEIATELQKRHDPNWDKKRREAKAKREME